MPADAGVVSDGGVDVSGDAVAAVWAVSVTPVLVLVLSELTSLLQAAAISPAAANPTAASRANAIADGARNRVLDEVLRNLIPVCRSYVRQESAAHQPLRGSCCARRRQASGLIPKWDFTVAGQCRIPTGFAEQSLACLQS